MDRFVSTQLPPTRTASPLRYLGGKSELLRHISQRIGSAKELREVFAGGASVSLYTLAAGQVERVWLNDLDEHVVAFWRVVADHHEELLDKWNDYRFSADGVKAFQQSLYPRNGEPEPLGESERAFRRVVLAQSCYSGDPQGGVGEHLRVKDKDNLAARIRSAHGWLAGRCKITQFDFQRVIEAPGTDVVLYVDPPYFTAGHMYHRDFSEEDHVRLADTLRHTSHRWILSYDDHPLIRSLYGGWCDFVNISDYTSGMHRGDKPQRVELIISPKRGCGRHARDDHDVLNEILSVLIDNEPWRNHRTAHRRHEEWLTDGSLLDRLRQHAVRLGLEDKTKERGVQVVAWLERANNRR